MQDTLHCNRPEIQPPLPAPEMQGIRTLLASGSPRRRELLGMILPQFEIAATRDVDESYPADMDVYDVPAYLSRLKAEAYTTDLQPNELLITADTVVILDGKILGKPHDHDNAIEMLHQISGKTQTVVTGVTLTTAEHSMSFSEHTKVHFRNLSDNEIRCYTELYKPYDKAGAYGIQEWIGAAGITGIDGCYYNVMGLPLNALYIHLRDFFSKKQ